MKTTGHRLATGTLVTWGCGDEAGHEIDSHVALSRRIAAVLGLRYGGPLESAKEGGRIYCVPRDTICGSECEGKLGRLSESTVFGGWVPARYLSTKAIVHPTTAEETAAPEGWPHEFARRVADDTLRGHTSFSRTGAVAAGASLLQLGAVRVKAVHARGGQSQFVATNRDELEDIIHAYDTGDHLSDALVLEENLTDVTTYSVGQVRIPGTVASYCGTQELTTNHQGRQAYGGSRLVVFLGGFSAVDQRPFPVETRTAIGCARRFDRLADRWLGGLIASRRNYDVAVGYAADGSRKIGVLEQSWRVGGATGAEISAIEAFKENPGLSVVLARTVERYDESCIPPAGAAVQFKGNDARVGPLVKYAVLEEPDP